MQKPYLAQTEPLPLHPTMRHPITGLPLQALGFTSRGPVWPQMGGSQPLGGPPAPAPAGIPTLGGPAPANPAPPAAGQPAPQPAPAPNPAPTGQPGGQGGQQPVPGQPGGQQPPAPVPGPPPGYQQQNDRGYPDGVPVESMAQPQQTAFWRHHARRNQDEVRRIQAETADYAQIKTERDQLRAANQTELQRAAAEAEARGLQQGRVESGSQVVEAYFRAAATNRMSEEAIAAQLRVLDRSGFMANGQVNTAAIYDHVNVIVGSAPQPYQPGQQQLPPPGGQPYGAPPLAGPQQPGPAYPPAPGYGYPPQQPGYGQQQGGYGQPPANAPAPYGQQAYPQGSYVGGYQPSGGPAIPAGQNGGYPQPYPGYGQPAQPGYGQPAAPQYAPPAGGPQGWPRQVPDYGQAPAQTAAPNPAEAGKQRAAERSGGLTRSAQRTAQAQVNGRPGIR